MSSNVAIDMAARMPPPPNKAFHAAALTRLFRGIGKDLNAAAAAFAVCQK
jgi:hypothetical protein